MSKEIKIIGWNVNGIRAVHRKGNWSWFESIQPDIFCVQETKASPEQLPEEVKNPDGYHSYFSSSQIRKGYSGVAVYSRIEPLEWREGIGVEKFDEQGRVLTLHFEKFILINVYVPNGNSQTAPLDFKLEFYEELLNYMNKLRSQSPIIMTGDINVAHEEIDLARPKENEKNVGFLPEERAWIDAYIQAGYVDTFRDMNPNKAGAYSYWDLKSGARERNVGWRIDYFFASQEIMPKIKKSEILSDVYGSDHCPISITIEI
ncbi:exodeoxyribonuclease III [Candidatus Campbellbacteria bacterium CG22_combo_CG10-13_8_21_14_all_36_13]|uniref:Exodeoxyribonuclease III n=1 Tax=Candidatus Campbellbacteria bacterium CG22_combo_CG10-13_8_21_14_all_36_13 TaxID=1974529 RepID=A0A2H0DXM9_9BACT|nr:MAG: exodeoxyribonuclease III [Candidatus Campbellbacteria bacterium CG22_combo_CG10-13_8_21_14_all_36_13]